MQKSNLIRWLLIFIFYISGLSSVYATEFKAKLNWYNLTNLSFRVNGIISSIKVKPGDIVNQNHKIIELDQREYSENTALTKSLRELRKNELNEAQRELDRALELYDRTVLSEHELQTVKNDFIASKTNYFTADTNWQKAKRDLEFSRIVAPFNAIILSIAVNEHETIVSSFESKPAVIIADSNKISAEFMLAPNDFNKINDNSEIIVIINGSSYKGTLFFPSLLIEKNSYRAAVVLSAPNDVIGKKLRSGMNAVVKIK
jgi:multidrug efflux system membrane fusion protein